MPTLFVDNLTNIDFAYLCPQRGLGGETWLMDVELSGALDDQGMVFDFGHVKRDIKALVDQKYDHALLVPQVAESISVEPRERDVRVVLELPDADARTRRIDLLSPAEAVALLPVPEITPERLASALEGDIRAVVPANVEHITVRLRAETIDGAFYHYTHGLKLHDGNCQRIAHGHRSQIQILRDGTRDAALEAAWAKRWTDIFIGTRGDQMQATRHGHLRFGYTAPQGRFELELPADWVDVITSETTVEHLAEFVAGTLAAEHGAHITVRAFEGYRKGAVAVAKREADAQLAG